jgi:hypothetical protein
MKVREMGEGRPLRACSGVHLNSDAKGVEVPGPPEPVVGDMQEGPSKMNMDIIQNMPLVDPNHVSLSVWNDNCVSMYTVGHNKDHPTPVQPFIHMVELKGRRGITAVVEGLFDDGALVNSICNSTFASLQEQLRNPTPSSKTLLMASPFSDLVHLRPATRLDNCPCQMGHPSWPALGPRLSGQSLYYPHG